MMTTSPTELSFDCKPLVYPLFSKSSGDRVAMDHRTQKLKDFLARLEQERLKIDAFKRELPLCMQLLNNAMEDSRQQLQTQIANQGSSRPVLEQFIPLKNMSTFNSSTDEATLENTENNISADKANWMTHAQLWNNQETSQETTEPSQTPLTSSPNTPKETHEIKLALNGKQRLNNNGAAFHPFSTKDLKVSSTPEFPELALASSHKEEMEDTKHTSEHCVRRENSTGKNSSGSIGEKLEEVGNNNNTSTSSQPHRKARRCWSPDLHRRFVNALHMLGGSQVATPKQIRELMKVDGLTNDEVKSHLQKYRLHTRRPSPSPQATVAATPQVVVLGGIWVPPEYAAAAAGHGGAPPPGAFYGPHAVAAHHHMSTAAFSPAVQENRIYPAIAPPPPQMPNNHQFLHMYNNNTNNNNNIENNIIRPPASIVKNNSSSDDDMQSDANIHVNHDPSESIEGEKSAESGNWKADQQNDGDHQSRSTRRVLAVDNEESNGSVVSLNI